MFGDRQTEREADRQTDRHETCLIQLGMFGDKDRYTQTRREKDRTRERQEERKTRRETDRQTNKRLA